MTYFNGVKQLEWHYSHSTLGVCYSEHAFGYYEICKGGNEYLLGNGDSLLKTFSSQREAQEFAQQLFNEAVMYCVEISNETYQC